MKIIKRFYDWMLTWAEKPSATPALFGFAFAEASIFPIPPDPMLMALGFGAPKRALRFGIICTVGSVLGGLFGYLLGALFQDQITFVLQIVVDGLSGTGAFIGTPDAGIVIDQSGAARLFGEHVIYQNGLLWRVTQLYQDNAFLAVLGAALTPIPYKVFTITAGYCAINIPVFIVASILGRGLRFATISILIWQFGSHARGFIEKYFNYFAWLFFILLAASFMLVKYL